MPRTAKKDKNLTPGKPLKPSNLSARAAQEWDRLISELDAAGIQVTQAHRTPLTLSATISADISAAWDVIKKDGAFIETKTGPAQHPAVKRLDALRRDYIKVLSTLGIRACVADRADAEGENLEDVLNGD